MQKEPEIVFRGVEHSAAVEDAIMDRIEKISERYRDVVGCTVTVDAPHRHQHKGHLYSVSIDLSAPGKELVVSRDPQKDHAHEDIYVAIRDAFDAMDRQVKKFFAIQRAQDVKVHDERPRGKVDRLFAGEGYGFISTPNGRHIYFQSAALDDVEFEDISVGDPVEFVEQPGEDGPQASFVRRLG